MYRKVLGEINFIRGNMIIKNKTTKLFCAILIFALVPVNLYLLINNVQKAHAAATITGLSDTLTRTKTGQLSSHTIAFTLSQTDEMVPNTTITLDFHEDDSGFTVNGASTVVTDFDFRIGSTDTTIYSDCSGHSGTSDISESVNDSTGVVTFTACSSFNSSAAAVVIKYGTAASIGGSGVNRVTNPAAGSKTIDVGGTIGETGKLAVVITSEDQLSVSANVDPTLAFTMTPTTLTFGILSTANIRYADNSAGLTTIPAQAATPLLTASTNGASGVLISVYDAGNGTGGLYSSVVSELIPPSAVNAITTGTKKFGVTGLSGSSLTATPGFNGTGAGGTGAISNVAQSFATSSGPVASGNIAMILVGSIDATTKAGSYTDTVTVVCTGRY